VLVNPPTFPFGWYGAKVAADERRLVRNGRASC
jgi:hypothetical protein